MKNLMQRFIREESGQDLIEYALLASLIAIATIVLMRSVATGVNGVFGRVVTALS